VAKDRAQAPGDVNINKLAIISSTGDKVDLRDVFSGLDIFENMFNNSISGAITIADSLNLIETLPIIGNEKIIIEVSTPSLKSSSRIKIEGRIYKISNRAPLKENTIGYVLHFTSPEQLYSTGLKISKSYKDMVLSDMAKDVYTNYLEPIRKKKFVAEPTMYPRSVILANWSPFFSLNWFAKNCKSDQYSGASFVFFERRDAFIFTSLESLFGVAPQANYFYGIKNTVDDKTQTKSVTDFHNADKYKVKRFTDTLENLQQGMYSGKLISNDLVKRKIETEYFNYNDDFSKFRHLNKSKMTNSTVVNEFVTSNITILPKQFNAFGETDEGTKLDEIIMDRKSQLQQLTGVQIEVEVPGDTRRSIGDVVTFTVPSYQPPGKKVKPGKDKYISGKYLVTALRHVIESDSHLMIMELSSDSFAQELPPAGWRG
jgi:hypothetical protein